MPLTRWISESVFSGSWSAGGVFHIYMTTSGIVMGSGLAELIRIFIEGCKKNSRTRNAVKTF
jgi:hypothetical protein